MPDLSSGRDAARGMATAIVTATTLTACSEPSTVTEIKPLTKMEPPPADVPSVTISDHEVKAGFYEWIIDGAAEKFQAAPNQDDIRLPLITPVAQPFSIVVGSPVRPAQLVVVAFTELNDRGVPDGPGNEIDCTESHDPCRINQTPTTLVLQPTIPADTKIIVIHLGYWAESPTGPGLALNSASWGARLSPP